MNRNFKNMLTITIAILAMGLVPLASGCTSKSVFIPEAIQLEPGPIMITADQLYEEYMTDEAAADAKYKGSEVWFTKVIEVWFYEDEYWDPETETYVYFSDYSFTENEPVVYLYFSSLSKEYIMIGNIIFMPQSSSDLQDIEAGYVVDIVGECQGLSQEHPFGLVVTVEISQIEVVKSRPKTGQEPQPPPPAGYY